MDDQQRINAEHERLLQDVPTQEIIDHLARRMICMVIGYSPKVDNENIYTNLTGDVAEREAISRTLVYDAIEASLPQPKKPG